MKCRIVRFLIACRLDADQPLSSRLARHSGHCPECAAWLRTQRSLIRQLRRPLPAAGEPPPFLQMKILRSLGDNQAARAQPQTPPWIWRTGAAAAALMIALTVAVAVLMPQAPRNTVAAVVPAPPPAALSVAGLRLPDSGVLLQAAATLDQPLQHEMALLKEDALAAFHALKTGFVPEPLRSKQG